MIGLHCNPAKLMSSRAGFPAPVPHAVMRVVGAAVTYAWNVIRSDPTMHLAASGPGAPIEDVYTDAICECLLQMLKAPNTVVDGFSGDTFETVSRSENLSNFNSQSLNKQPDLIIRLANGPLRHTSRYVGIFVEAKVVSMKKPITEYTAHGLARFVRGDYAWAMQGALMIAYQVHKFRPRTALESELQKDLSLCAVPDASGAYFESLANMAPLCGKSVHMRQWKYNSGDDPGPISIWHMWSLNEP